MTPSWEAFCESEYRLKTYMSAQTFYQPPSAYDGITTTSRESTHSLAFILSAIICEVVPNFSRAVISLRSAVGVFPASRTLCRKSFLYPPVISLHMVRHEG